MNKHEPLLSVVVPTRNRFNTLNIIVEQFMSWSSEEFELVIEDNSDSPDAFKVALAQYGSDPRLRYTYAPTSRSAIENCDAAIRMARGKVVTFIGDDDSITRQSIEAAAWMIENSIDALVCKIRGYTWPDMEHAIAINHAYNGKLAPLDTSSALWRVDVGAELTRLARCGAQDLGSMPRLYQSLVQRRALERMYEDLGTYFPGPVPDMANAVALSHYIQQCYYTTVPLVISGQSKSSMSGKNSVRRHQGSLDKEKSLPHNTAKLWDKRIPAYWSAPTIWAEAALKASEATKQSQFLKQFSFAHVYANCLVFNHRRFYPLIGAAILANGSLKAILLIPFIAWFAASKTVERATNLTRKLLFGIKGNSFPTVADAATYVECWIDRYGLLKHFKLPSSRTAN